MKKAVWTTVDPLTARLGCISLIAAGVCMGVAGLLSAPVCSAAVIMMLVVAVALPTLDGPRWADSRIRPFLGPIGLLAVLVLGRFFPAPASTTRTSFAVEHFSDPQLAGLVAAFAAGVLVVTACECGERRGLYATLVLSVSVIALTILSSPVKQMIPAMAIGWASAMLSMARMVAHTHRIAQASDVSWTTFDRLTARLIPRRDTIVLGIAVLMSSVLITAGHTVTAKEFVPYPVGWGSARKIAAADARHRHGSSYFGNTLDLRMKGRPGDRPFADVPADGPHLLRMGTLNTYDSVSGWSATDRGFFRPSMVHSGLGDISVLRRTDDVSLPIPNTIMTYRVTNRSADAGSVMAPGPVLALASPLLTSGVDIDIDAGDRLHIQGSVPGGSTYDVTATALLSADRASDESTLRGIPVSDPARPVEVRDLYLPLPPSVPARVSELGQRLVQNVPDLLSAVTAVTAEVRSRIAYREDAPVAVKGADPVDDALFITHQGSSEQIASAEVLLLRAGGVPARVAVGFAGGDQHGGTRTLRDSDARAWAEVWFPGWGWVTSEPAPQSPARPSIGQWVREHLTAAAHTAYNATLAYPRRLGFDSFVLLAVILYALVTRRNSIRRRRAIRGPNGQPIDPALTSALIRLERALRSDGGRTLHQTPQTMITRLTGLAAARPGLASNVLQADRSGLGPAGALLILERALDSAKPPRDSEIQAAAAVLSQAARDVRRSGPRLLSRARWRSRQRTQ